MKQLKEMPEPKKVPTARFRYWTTPPEVLTLRVADIEAAVPKANWKSGGSVDGTFQIPASVILSKNVPRISLQQLSEILPEHVLPSDGVIRLPVSRLAAAYQMVEHSEELPPEIVPVEEKLPEVAPVEEKLPEVAPAADLDGPPPAAKETADLEKPDEQLAPVEAPAPEVKAIETAVPAALKVPPVEPPGPTVPPVAPPPAAPLVPPAPEEAPRAGKFPAKRIGGFGGLPIFRKKATTHLQQPAPEGESAEAPRPVPRFSGIRLPQIPVQRRSDTQPLPPSLAESLAEPAPVEPAVSLEIPAPEPAAEAFDVTVPEIPAEPVQDVLPEPEPSPVEAVQEPASAPEPEPVIPPPAAPAPAPEPPSVEAPVFTMLSTESASREVRGNEISEQEPLQALFLTDETMTVDRVIELCGGLPGINSCVLAHGSIVVASHNVPDGVDLVSMSAHAADMLRAMRESSARMGVGTVPAVTLHTEKGVISFFHRDDLTMLVFHRDRGFVPGVREKMAAVLGELTKARLTLPVGTE